MTQPRRKSATESSPQYIMENDREVARLEGMLKQKTYQPSAEVVKLKYSSGHRVLDAGCGSAMLARYIADTYSGTRVEACDLSEVRVAQARELRKMQGKEDIRYFQSPLEAIAVPDNTYDRVVCRYVFEFLADPGKVLGEFLRVLKPGGQALVIQFDGFLFNYFHKNEELSEMLEAIRKHGHPDLFRGRKVPSLYLDAGFKDVDWDVEVHPFKGEELKLEREQMRERLDFSAPGLAPILGGLPRAKKFRDLYCEELDKPGSVLFYNKFFVWGRKG